VIQGIFNIGNIHHAIGDSAKSIIAESADFNTG
jgi:hypothetical protein